MVKDCTNLKKYFLSLQKQMIEKLSSGRDILSHPSLKGDVSEINWINWLKLYLPKRYSVDKAFAIDSNNHYSQQLDLVIYDRQYSPFVFNQDSAIYIPAESVYAVFEVKQEIDKRNMIYAGNKIESVRKLDRTSAKITYAGGIIDKPKSPFRIIGGILTLTSGWVDTFGDSFNNILKEYKKNSQIDIGCVLEKGSFIADYNNDISVNVSTKEEALIYFFLNLLIQLHNLGTVPAMDIRLYAKALDSFN